MKNLETSHQLLNEVVDQLEITLGFETNRETLKEGRNLFVFECMFSDDNNNITKKKFEVSVGNRMVTELK
jgi:hypothetical protein